MTVDKNRPAPSQNELIPFVQQGNQVMIDAHLLHRQLKAKGRFYDWITYRIKEYGFKEGEDFVPEKSSTSNGRGGDRRSVSYLLTIDMAKELAMLERSETGRQVRRYFIAAEKRLRMAHIEALPPAAGLFKGLKPSVINGRKLYPYRELLRRIGYNERSSTSQRRARYGQHFVDMGHQLFITEEFATHLYHSRQVYLSRLKVKESQPVLPFNFGQGGIA